MNLPAILHPLRQASKVIAVALAIAACVLITSSSKAVGLTQTVSSSASGDTQIRSANPNTNYGGATTITVDGDEPAGTGRDTVALIRFSLPTLPAGAAITDTKLRLDVTNSSTNTYNVYVIKKAWVEAEASWNEYKSGTSWAFSGARDSTDRESPPVASITPNTTGVRDFDLGQAFDRQVGQWIRGVEANNGIQLINVYAPDGFGFATREGATASQRPRLVITYDDGIVADTTPPETTSDSGPSGTVISSSATFNFSSSESNSTFECSLDGGGFASCTSPKSYTGLTDGAHTFQVKAKDAAGNTDASPASQSWTIDATPPTISTVSPAENATGVAVGTNVSATFSEAMTATTINDTTFTLTNTANNSPVTATVSYNAANNTATLTPSSPLANSTDYRANVTTEAKDSAGNALAANKTWTFTTAVAPPPADTTPPETTSDSGPSGTVNSSSASFAFSSDEAGSTFECKLDGADYSACTSTIDYTNLSNGSHTFEVRATDAAGNTDATPASRTWTVALPAPPPPLSGTLEKFEPSDGQAYDGVDANQKAGDTVAISTQKWADYSANVLGGEKPLISHTFTGYDTNMTFDTGIAKARGAVPFVSWQTGSGTSPKTIANAGQASSGNRSDYVILKVAHALRTYDQPVFLRIDQEMNAYWFAWCAYNSDGTLRAHTTEDFKDMWRRIHIIFDGGTVSEMNSKLAAEGMPPLDQQVGTSAASKGLSSTTDPNAYLAPTNNVAFVFNPVDAPGIPNKVGNLWADYYPGDKYVDWVGQTSYDTTWNATMETRFSWLEAFYQDFTSEGGDHEKPYMMGEWGLTSSRGDDPAYIQRITDWQKAHPGVKALIYFNVQKDSTDHRLESYPNSATVMRTAAPSYLNQISTP